MALCTIAMWFVYCLVRCSYRRHGDVGLMSRNIIFTRNREKAWCTCALMKKTNLSLPQINYKRLRLLPNLLIDPTKLEDWETVPPATNLMTDVVYSGANATLPHYSYYSDGRAILYAGEIVQNPPAHRQSISRHFRHGVILPQISTASITKANAPIATSN